MNAVPVSTVTMIVMTVAMLGFLETFVKIGRAHV